MKAPLDKEKLHEIVEKTTQKYLADPKQRGVGAAGCMYCTDDGRTCAIGMWADNPAELQEFADRHSLNSIGALWHASPQKLNRLLPRLAGVPIGLLKMLQNWHDNMPVTSPSAGARHLHLCIDSNAFAESPVLGDPTAQPRA